MVGDIARIDGRLLSTTNISWAPFDRLTEYDQNSKPNPTLAESWDVSSDLASDQAQLTQGRHVALGPRVH
jgi:ABC-type transport system substrate-binding protein